MQMKYFLGFFLVCMARITKILDARLLSRPSSQEVVIGDEAHFSCTTSEPFSVNWQHKAIGSERYEYVFIEGVLINPYDTRFRIEVDKTIGRYDLIIPNVTWPDAGTFKCIDDAGQGEEREGELTVLAGRPTCTPLSSLSNVVGENDCGIEPDELQFECHLQFSGNLVPTLDWKVTGGQPVTPKTRVVEREANDLNETVTFISTKDVDGRSYTYETKLSRHKWTSAKVQVSYVLMTNKTSKVITDPSVETCVAKSNQKCSYFWKKNNEVVTKDSSYRVDTDGAYECWANCALGRHSCLLPLAEVNFTRNVLDESHKNVGLHIGLYVLIAIAAVLLVALVIAIVFCCRYRQRLQEMMNKCNCSGPRYQQLCICFGDGAELDLSMKQIPEDKSLSNTEEKKPS